MEYLSTDWDIIESNYCQEIISKICQFTGNEFSAYRSKIPLFANLKGQIENGWESFISHFSKYSPCFNPHFYSDKIKEDFNSNISADRFDNIIPFFENLIKLIRWKNATILERTKSEYIYPNHKYEFDNYIKSSTAFLEICQCAVENLQSSNPDPKYIDLAIRYELLKYKQNFALSNLFHVFQQFPLIRRREILETATNRLISDIEYENQSSSVLVLINDKNLLITELKRLSDIMNVNFDIDLHDGQHFSYSCEKLFVKCQSMEFKVDNTSETVPPINNPSILDRLNYIFLNETAIDGGLKTSFNSLIALDEKAITLSLRKFNNQKVKELSIDKLTALLRLQFCRNKILFHSIIRSIQEISELHDKLLTKTNDKAKEITKSKKEASPKKTITIPEPEDDTPKLSEEELEKLNQSTGNSRKNIIKKNKKATLQPPKILTFYETQYSLFVKELLVAASSIKENSKIVIDNEKLMEQLLITFDDFYKKKILIVKALVEINRNIPVHSNKEFDFRSTVEKFIELRPNLLCGIHSSCLTPFRLTVDILTELETALRTLINFQNFNSRLVLFENVDQFEWFMIPFKSAIFQESNDEFPYSLTDVYSSLSRIPDFLGISIPIATEICTSFSARLLKFQSYFIYSTWNQLIKEMSNLLTNTSPESYQFNMNISKAVSQLMSSQYLNNISFIHEQITTQDTEIQSQYATKLRKMIKFSQKLRKFLIRTDNLLPIFRRHAKEIAKTDIKDVIDLAYGDFNFCEFDENCNLDELFKILTSQQNFYLSLFIATRFNNFADDANFVASFFELTGQSTRSPLYKQSADHLFYEPNLFKLNDFTSLFCDISSITQEVVTDTSHIIEMFLPYCIKTEIAYICGYERNFLSHYSNIDTFVLDSTPELGQILTDDNKLNPLNVPSYYQSLAIKTNSVDILRQLLQFVSIRLQLNAHIRHELHITQSKPKTIENIYNENLMNSSPFFSRISVELKKSGNGNDLNFCLSYLELERTLYLCKHQISALNLYESVICPTQTPPPIYSLNSIQSYLSDMQVPPLGSSLFMTPSLYIQNYLNQFWYQCHDTFRADFLASQSMIEQKIDDAVVGFGFESDNRQNAHDFALGSLRLSYLKLAYYLLIEKEDPSEVSLLSAINENNKETYTKGKVQFDKDVNIKSTTRIGRRRATGTIETILLREKTSVLLEVMKILYESCMKEIIQDQFNTQVGLINDAFSAPNQSLKPDCYSKRQVINSVRTTYLPTVSSIEEQLKQELGYAHSRFCHTLYRLVLISSSNEDGTPIHLKQVTNHDEIVQDMTFYVDITKMTDELNDMSKLLTGFVNQSQHQMSETWKGYLANVLREFTFYSDRQILLNGFVRDFIDRYNGSIELNLTTKLKDLFNQLASLREQERSIHHEHDRYVKAVTRDIKQEYDELVSDLAEEIRKAKEEFIRCQNEQLGYAHAAIDKFMDNPTFMENITNAEIASKFVDEPIEIRDPNRRTLVKLQIRKKKEEREQRNKLRKLHRENRRLKREARQKRLEAKRKLLEQRANQPQPTPPEQNEEQPEEDLEQQPQEADQQENEVQIEKKDVGEQTNSLDALTLEDFNDIEEEEEEDVNEDDYKYSDSEDDDFDEDGKKKKKKKDINQTMNEIREDIAQLELEKKKLRASTAISTIGFKKIYNRMINKTAQEKKEYSATLWHSQRLLEEDLEAINDHIGQAYNQLTQHEIEIERLRGEIDEEKQKSAKLLHWKEVNLRHSDNLSKEVKRLLSESENEQNINVTKLLQKIEARQEELEMLDYENAQLEEEIYYEVREPIKQVDILRRTLTRRRAYEAQEMQEKKAEEEAKQKELTQSSKMRFQLQEPSMPSSARSSRSIHSTQQIDQNQNDEEAVNVLQMSQRPVSERGIDKLQELTRKNEQLKSENELIRNHIKELEEQLSSHPNAKLPQITDMFQMPSPEVMPFSARPKSTRQSQKTIIRPGVGRSFIGNIRPGTSRL